MKKFITIISAFMLTAAFTGCTSKNPDIPGEPVVSDPEPVFTEYFPEDFTEIDVQLVKQDGESPLTFKRFDLQKMDYDIKKPVCYDTTTLEDYIESMHISKEVYENNKEAYSANYEATRNSKIVPIYAGGALVEDRFYYAMNYDFLHDTSGSHEMGFYCLDYETGESEEIYRYSSTDALLGIYWDMSFYQGNLIFLGNIYKNGESTYVIYTLDPVKHELKELSDPPTDKPFYTWKTNYNTGDLYLIDQTKKDNTDIFKFNGLDAPDDQKWSIVDLEATENIKEIEFYKNGFIYSYKNEDKTISAECDDFRINTGLKGAELMAVYDNKVTFRVFDTISTVIYTYDLEKMERYKTSMSMIGSDVSVYAVGNELVAEGGKSRFVFIPEIGAAFRLGNISNYSPLCSNGNTAYGICNQTSYKTIFSETEDGESKPISINMTSSAELDIIK